MLQIPKLRLKEKFEMNDLITCFGLIVLCILANSSFVMNPSLSLSSAWNIYLMIIDQIHSF